MLTTDLPRKSVADEHPGGHRPEDGVHERGEDGDDDAQLQRGHRLRVRDGVPEARRAVLPSTPQTSGGQRQHDDQREVGRDEAEGEGRSGPLPRPARAAWRGRCGRRSASQIGPPTCLLDPDHDARFGSNHFLSTVRQPPKILSSILKMPGRAGYFDAYFFATARVDRPPAVLAEQVLRDRRPS